MGEGLDGRLYAHMQVHELFGGFALKAPSICTKLQLGVPVNCV